MSVRVLWRDMAAQRKELGGAGVLGAIASASAVALLGTSAWLIATAAGQPPVLTLSVAAVLVRALALGRAVFRYLERLAGHDAAFRGLTELRVKVYGQLERLAPVGLAAFGRGDLMARLVADVDSATDLPLRVVLPWLQAGIVSAATVAFFAWLLPGAGLLLGILAVAALSLVPWIAWWSARASEHRVSAVRARMSGDVVRALDATADLSSFDATDAACARVSADDVSLTALSERSSYALGLGAGLGTVLQGVAVVGSIALASAAVADGSLGAVWLAVAGLLPLALFEVLSVLPASALALERLRGSADRIEELYRLPAAVQQPHSPQHLGPGFTGLSISATARWPQMRRHAVEVNGLRIDPGDRVAVVGPSGSGKSTLAAVVTGFLSYEGSVLINGVELREVDDTALRSTVGILAQQAHIFDTSIADNVRIGGPTVNPEAVRESINKAKLGEWIDSLPLGVETEVGSFGVGVSGGERQRIALARLLLADRPFVVLDEPTEHLDGPTAQALMDTVAYALHDTTVLLITHRLAGLEAFDRIVELADGKVMASGTHAELLSRGGWYAQQYAIEAEQRDMSALLPKLPIGVGVPHAATWRNGGHDRS